jgi:predicted AlkP superfamily pyrophosphatase or phosphodiesterase
MDTVTRKDLKIELKTRTPGWIRASDRQGPRHPFLRHLLASLAQFGVVLLLPLLVQAAEPVVILISWDGTRHDYPDRVALPGLERLAREGVRARLVPVFPTNTFPNHVTLATGAYSARHGVVGNSFLDRERGRFHYDNDASWLDAEPIWVAAERQGIRSAVFFWVGSETDWRDIGATYRRSPFDGSVPESQKVDQILDWLDLPEAERPRLIMTWWHGADAVGHRKGPEHPAVAQQLKRQDRELVRLLGGLDTRGAWDTTTLIVTSDHGMSYSDRHVDVVTPLRQRGIGVQIVPGGGTAFLWLDDPARRRDALRVLGNLKEVQAYASQDLPTSFNGYHPKRSGDIIVMTKPPYRFDRPSVIARLVGVRGAHGYAPDHPEMAAIFYAMGRGVPRGVRLGAVRAIDVAPSVAGLLAIDPPRHAEGTPALGWGERQ